MKGEPGGTDRHGPHVPYYIGIDGGGTRTTLALCDGEGREILRRSGPAGIVDPRHPAESASMLHRLVRESTDAAALSGPAAALCAGLAGTGSSVEREAVAAALRDAGVARIVLVREDGETALEGALEGGPGLLLIAGTGSVGWGRSQSGAVQRTGGWGAVAGDQGSGYQIGKAALSSALASFDGRGPPSDLLPELLRVTGLTDPNQIPPWAGRSQKSEIAALARPTIALALEGDEVAIAIVREAAEGLVAHAAALITRLGPWTGSIPVVLHGGLTAAPFFVDEVRSGLARLGAVELRPAAGDAVAGALHIARFAHL